MKAMAARPAAPKEAASLAPAPVNGLTGLEEVAAGVELALDQADQVLEAATGVELVELAELEADDQALQLLEEAETLVLDDLELEEEEDEDQLPQVLAPSVVLEAEEEVVDDQALQLLDLELEEEEVVEEAQLLQLLAGSVVLEEEVVADDQVDQLEAGVVVVLVDDGVVLVLQVPQEDSEATGPAAARPARAATATKDFILIDWFCWFVRVERMTRVGGGKSLLKSDY